MRVITAVPALALVFTLAASTVAVGDPPAPNAKPQRPQHACFFHDEVSGFSAPDQHTLYLRVSVRDVYKLETFGPCFDMDWAMRLALVSRSGDWICVGDPADVVVRQTGMGHQRCPVRVVAKLTPDEVKALPKKSRP
jgi:hypothetical protein